MQVVKRFHAFGTTRFQQTHPSGDYYYIQEGAKFYHFCYVHKERAEQTMVALQASWDELANQVAQSKANLRELLKANPINEKAITKAHRLLEALQEKQKETSECDRDLFTNFRDSPSDCIISNRAPHGAVIVLTHIKSL